MPETWSDQLKPRSAYEAIDFGFLFVREHYVPLLSLALVFVLPVSLLLSLLFSSHLAWVSFVMWWAKPVWERPMLRYLSRALFEAPPSLRETLSEIRVWGVRDLIPSLTTRRLSPSRSFEMPVTVLEGSVGKDRSARLLMLRRGPASGAAMSLTILLVHIEIFLIIGFLMLAAALIPEAANVNFLEWLIGFEETAESSTLRELLYFALGELAAVLVAPYYVGAGFSLYLHRRTELEAWDLELAFRELAERVSAKARKASSMSVLLLLLALLVAPTQFVSEAAAAPLDPEQARASIEEVMAGEAFHQIEIVSIPKFILDWELDQEQEAAGLPQWLTDLAESIATFVGGGLEVVILAVAVAAIGWLVLRVIRQGGFEQIRIARRPTRRSAAPRELFGLEISEDSLPEDVVAEALSLVRAREFRACLALLYRGGLSRLATHHGVDLAVGVTERECLDVARPLLSESAAGYFASLTSTWLRCAYGHVEPEAEELEMLCRNWSSVFAAPVSGTPIAGVESAAGLGRAQ